MSVCHEPPRLTPGSVVCYKDSQDVTESHSQLWFITAEGHKAKPAKGKGIKSRGNQMRASKGPLSQQSQTEQAKLLQQRGVTTYVKYCLPGKFMRDPMLTVFTGATFCPPILNYRHSDGEQVFSINLVLNSLSTVNHSYWGMVGTLPNPRYQTPAKGQLWIRPF